MRIALKELLREPGRFLPVGVAMTLLVVLLVVLGGFLDGLELAQTGGWRAHRGAVLLFEDGAELLVDRSRITPEQRATVTDDLDVPVGGLVQVATTAEAGGEVVDILLVGHDVGTDVLPEPTSDGAIVDAALADVAGIAEGDVLLVGPTAREVVVAVLVDDLTQGSPTVWVPTEDWRDIVAEALPTALPPDGVVQALVVPDADPSAVALAGLQTATADDVIDALPVVQQQSATFQGIIGVTFAVTLLVVALFFALLTLERVGLYAVLKAIGARTGDLLVGLATQAVLLTALALLAGVALSAALVAALPPDLPVRVLPGRVLLIAAGTVVVALLGSLSTLRRLLAIDPAESIG